MVRCVYTHASSNLVVTVAVNIGHSDMYVHIVRRRSITFVVCLFQYSLDVLIFSVVLLLCLLRALSQLASVCKRAVRHYTTPTQTRPSTSDGH